MSSTFPSILTTYVDPQATDKLNSPSHSGIEQNQNSGLEQVEAVIGTLSSVAGTLMYDIRAAASNGGGHIQTATTGGTGQTSFSKGDMLAASSSSVLGKIMVGSDTQVLTADSTQTSGVKWATPPSGATGLSVSPQPPVNLDVTVGGISVTSVLAGVSAFVLPFSMVVNRLSLIVGATINGSVSAAIYSEDGQTRQASVAGFGIASTAGTAAFPIPISSVSLSSGTHYLAITTTLQNGFNVYASNGVGTYGPLLNTSPSKPIYGGTMAVSAGVLPATIAPSSITSTNVNYWMLRLDN